jgi:hypothetical protein
MYMGIHVKYPLRYACKIFIKLEFSPQIFGNSHTSNFMKIRPVGVELLHEGGRTERHGEANGHFSQIRQRAIEQDALE